LLLELMLDVNKYYISSNNGLHNTRKKQEADQDSAQAPYNLNEVQKSGLYNKYKNLTWTLPLSSHHFFPESH
jgi:hypothetical protein